MIEVVKWAYEFIKGGDVKMVGMDNSWISLVVKEREEGW